MKVEDVPSGLPDHSPRASLVGDAQAIAPMTCMKSKPASPPASLAGSKLFSGYTIAADPPSAIGDRGSVYGLTRRQGKRSESF